VNSSPDNKVKNSIFSRFRLNKAVDNLAKTPNKGRNTHQSKQPQSPPFLARLASRLSSANTSTNTSQPIGLPKVTSSPRLFAGRKKIPKSTAAPKTLSRQLFNCICYGSLNLSTHQHHLHLLHPQLAHRWQT
jgi:hypothetical protein